MLAGVCSVVCDSQRNGVRTYVVVVFPNTLSAEEIAESQVFYNANGGSLQGMWGTGGQIPPQVFQLPLQAYDTITNPSPTRAKCAPPPPSFYY